MKIELLCPNNNRSERNYICSFLFHELLGLDFQLYFHDNVCDYIIKFASKVIIIKDHFFNYYTKNLEYLNIANFPNKFSYFDCIEGFKIPIIYGENKYTESDNTIVCGLDIFASSFFLLSRWEEYLLGREENGICNEDKLFCVRNNIFQRPIVNEYEELLKFFLIRLGLETFSFRALSLKITHDVDRCFLSGWKELSSNAYKQFLKKSYKKSFKLIYDYLWHKLFLPQPFDTFDYFMDQSDKIGVKSEFYFKCCEQNESGFTYKCEDIRVKSIIENINNKGHIIGFHPSESTFNNDIQFEKELDRLSNTTNFKLVGRNHGLLCNSFTLNQWERYGFSYISNFGFQKRNGFRTGIAVPYPIFDIYKQKQLYLIEYPFIIMDTVMMRNRPQMEDAIKDINFLISKIKKHNGVLVVNWHTNVINMRSMLKYKDVFSEMLQSFHNNSCEAEC